MTDSCVLVTGAFGLVGSAVVAELASQGGRVVATDLDVPANRKRADAFTARPGVDVRWADLTSATDVDALLAAVTPTAIVHLAAIIPPFCYARPGLAHAVNVNATASLVRAASVMPTPPRFVQASSVAVYGARNPHRTNELLTASTPLQPSDLYGAHKVLAEECVTNSALEWVVLRLGGVLLAEPQWALDRDLIFFEAVLPSDGRIQTVDARDVARAFTAATVTEHVREVFLIGGDDTHRVTQADVTTEAVAAMGLRGGLPAGRPGNPDDDRAWFATDWMDTEHAQNVLGYQRHSLPAMCAEIRARVGWRRWLLRPLAPVLRWYLRRRSPYRGFPGHHADPWGAIEKRWGDPRPAPRIDAEVPAVRR
ncbi:NAD(P)-dependent oxidoreductase [Mycobacterium sp. SP-6446]|uniref:NAD-dependent epimerase/dehydratase family protein n=1 Tax=Mycobacterium sp. SP-6446 TaxID=1834162 RepID=UPI00096ED642|nr:NAD-dependent epimerase/dehydratase family protein [Mycobacterium sp. SP-6446]OMC15367.1 oxidoreductase [Mycobacterium sp. SP-6446]